MGRALVLALQHVLTMFGATVAVPLLLFEMGAYWAVSRNRHRLSRWFGLTQCALDRPDPAS